jgi:hypothetical protein
MELTTPSRSVGVVRITSASMAMSCVADANTSTMSAAQNTAVFGGTDPTAAIDADSRSSAPQIQMR